MGFCPNCGYEYQDEVKTCPDCDIELVDQLPKEEHRDINFVPLPNLPGRVYAEMLKEVLDRKGIPCYIKASGVTGAYRISSSDAVSEGVRLFVPEEKLQECMDLQHGMLDHI